MILDQYFQRIAILSLPGQEQRAQRALDSLAAAQLSNKAVVVMAVRGDELRPPAWFRGGNGAWGCLQSHVRVLQDAWLDGMETVLVLEDDCVWVSDAARLAEEFLKQLPEDWEQVYLGGQHRKTPSLVPGLPAVYRAQSVNRTHAYAVKRAVIPRMLQHVLHAPDYIDDKGDIHIDHQLERAHQAKHWKIYSPAWWLAGQGENQSMICGRALPAQWWQHTGGVDCSAVPVVVFPEGPHVDDLASFHFGRNTDTSYFDSGVKRAGADEGALKTCFRFIAAEAAEHFRLPAIRPVNEAQVAALRSVWPGGVMRRSDLTDDEVARLRDHTVNGLLKHPWLSGATPAAEVVSSPPSHGRRPVFVFALPECGGDVLARALDAQTSDDVFLRALTAKNPAQVLEENLPRPFVSENVARRSDFPKIVARLRESVPGAVVVGLRQTLERSLEGMLAHRERWRHWGRCQKCAPGVLERRFLERAWENLDAAATTECQSPNEVLAYLMSQGIEVPDTATHLLERYQKMKIEPGSYARIVHQVWIQGEAELPEEYQANREFWKKLLPDWTFMLWDNVSASDQWPDYAEVESQCSHHAMRADLILARAQRDFGGLAMGTDVKANNIVNLLSWIETNRTLVVANVSGKAASNGLSYFGAPSHPFISCVCRHQLRDKKLLSDRNVWRVTGPGCWYEALSAHMWDLSIATDRRAYTRLYSETEPGNPEAWVDPGYAGSWEKK